MTVITRGLLDVGGHGVLPCLLGIAAEIGGVDAEDRDGADDQQRGDDRGNDRGGAADLVRLAPDVREPDGGADAQQDRRDDGVETAGDRADDGLEERADQADAGDEHPPGGELRGGLLPDESDTEGEHQGGDAAESDEQVVHGEGSFQAKKYRMSEATIAAVVSSGRKIVMAGM
ncbi:hypothetical protein ACFQQB_51440 [Nonomuraea rubra]|uniref:hypothetical protein n=1 Tax=Nonomuraea rubra TaxID=46180 RepID=UPI00360B1F36